MSPPVEPFGAMMMRFETLDLVIIVAYLVGIVALGLFASGREKNTTGDYFLAGRSLRWPMIGMALFATNISTVHLVGWRRRGTRTDWFSRTSNGWPRFA